MERIHIIIGVIVFIIFTSAAAADEVLTKQERIVALTLLGEARGEGNNGMYAVGCVIQKRIKNRYKTAAEVCLEPWQFSVWNAGGGKVKKESDLQHLWKSCNATRYARKLAQHICSNSKLEQGFTGNADHYYSTDKKTPPYWTYKVIKKDDKEIKVPIKPTRKIGKHIFYKLR